jgi:formylglycine-generating enzyme required for sulfatase activity
MVYIQSGEKGYCLDKFEASASLSCGHRAPANDFETQNDLSDPACLPESVPASSPWVNIQLHEALAVCAKAGKRLPTNKEWYRASIGTPDRVNPDDPNSCALGRTGQTSPDQTGAHAGCVSSFGAFDMVGNVWEWVDGEVDNGMYGNHEVPGEGYVDEVDVDGVATKTSTSSDSAFGEDYFFIDKSGTRGMIRGGFWSLKEKAGIFSVNATIPTSFVGNAVGFRCARDAD